MPLVTLSFCFSSCFLYGEAEAQGACRRIQMPVGAVEVQIVNNTPSICQPRYWLPRHCAMHIVNPCESQGIPDGWGLHMQ